MYKDGKQFRVSAEGCGWYAVKTQLADADDQEVAVFNGRERLASWLCSALNAGTAKMVVAPPVNGKRNIYAIGGMQGAERLNG